MRIAQIAPLWASIPPADYGGIELILNLLCAGLEKKGHHVTLFASGDCQVPVPLHSIIPRNLSQLMSEGHAYVAEYYLTAALAEALSRQDDFDLFHSHLPLSWLPMAALSARPCLFTMHGSVHVDDLWALERYPHLPVAGISHAQCAPVRERLEKSLPIIHHCIDFDAYTPSSQPGQYLAFLGRMSHGKNPLGAIQIARATGLPLILAGQAHTSQEQSYFEEHIRPHLDGGQITWIGLVDHSEKVALLRHASALLFPIQWDEPFGLVMIEAMACGTPVLAVARGAVPEIVEHGITGHTAATIEELIECLPATLALDRTIVRQAALARFGSDCMVDDYVDLYSRLINSVAPLETF